jgi:hypothetical protein
MQPLICPFTDEGGKHAGSIARVCWLAEEHRWVLEPATRNLQGRTRTAGGKSILQSAKGADIGRDSWPGSYSHTFEASKEVEESKENAKTSDR